MPSIRLTSAVVATVVALSATGIGAHTYVSARDHEIAAHSTARAELERSSDLAEGVLATVALNLTKGQRALDDSRGRVLDESPREELSRALRALDSQVRFETFLMKMRSARAASSDPTLLAWPDDIAALTDDIDIDASNNLALGTSFTAASDRVSAATDSVRAAVGDWEAVEQFKREYRAAAASSGVRLEGPDGPRHFEVPVRTTAALWRDNLQAAVDAGGQVAIYYPGYATVISAHNYNDATALAVRIGDTVTFTGAYSGTYRAVSYLYIPSGAPVSVLSRLGASYGLQTCQWHNGRTTIVGLEPA